MVSNSANDFAWLEIVVVLFQVFGVLALCLTRLSPCSRWGARGRVAFVVALLGLGFAGALCGVNDSEFALFAGGTMTFLLIGMTVGNGHIDATGPVAVEAMAEATLAA